VTSYLTVTCRLPARAEEQLAAALERWPVLGCQVEGGGADLAVTVFLDAVQDGAIPGVRRELRGLGARDLGTAHFAEQDWLAEYRRTAIPCAIGERFWIDPHPQRPTSAPAGRVHLLVEPRQAFGSGSHESTRLVLMMLESLQVTGARVLDVGTGSGILALAARALGAQQVVGFDIDLDAVFIARQIVREQRRDLPVQLFAGSTAALVPRLEFDLILANLIPAEVLPLLPSLRGVLRPGGRLLLSGLMADQVVSVREELARQFLAIAQSRELDEWVGLVCTPT
jgi:ribosomal protein L11 methyltransferase